MNGNLAIKIDNLSKQYRLGVIGTGTISHDLNRWWTVNVRKKEDPYLKIGEINDRSKKAVSKYVWALKDIYLEIEKGDVVGIIGKNGAGKSTLLKILSKVTKPTTGSISYNGRLASLLEVGTGFHPEMTGRENIFMNGAIMGMTKAEISRKLDEIVDFSGVERYLDTPVKRYSSGMTVRLGFAIAAHLDPEILVVDEVLAVGDVEFQKKAIGKMQDVSKGEGRTVLFVSHNMASIKQLCSKGVLLENGTVSFNGNIEDTIAKYLAVNENELGLSLAERTYRIGNGKIKVTNIVMRNNNNDAVKEVFVGEPLDVEFHIQKESNVFLKDMIVACGFSDTYGQPIVSWVSDEVPCNFAEVKNNTFSLKIPKLNLRPGTYSFNYQISLKTTSPNDFCDVLRNAVNISVLSDNAISSTKLLKTYRGCGVFLKGEFIAN
jgi:lipopolysaccharide transport system ATP-binding protein